MDNKISFVEKISLVENELLNDKIQCVLRQTNYTEQEAKEKLQLFEYDEIKCIKDYMGISEKKAPVKSVSLNQQIYTEIRKKMGTSEIQRG